MKRIQFLLILPVIALLAFSCGSQSGKSEQKQITVLLANPTTTNLQTVQFLMEKEVFLVPANTRFIGVYHPSQTYKFERTQSYITEKGLTNFTLRKVEGELTDVNLFEENDCSPAYRELFDSSDGVIFFGGPDIQPVIFGEENTHSVVTDPGRHRFELSFIFHLLGGSRNEAFVPFLEERPDYVVTGFCLGMQTMNVATGGSLVQDIPDQIYGKNTAKEIVTLDREQLHRNYWQELVKDTLLMGINFHTIRFTSHPFFGETIKVSKEARPLIYSSHHQALKELGAGFEVTALSDDGKVIEAFAHSKYANVFAVQFHPEVNALYEDRAVRKFAPEDEPRTYHQILDPVSLDFHYKYWKHISDVLKN
jgi:putative glutamine amidotransferase